MTSMEPGNTGVDPRLSFDDPLLDGLLILCKLHGATVSRASLSAGLPLNKQRLSLDLLPRAAARAGLQARVLRLDGKEAVLGLRTIKECLEDPAKLLLSL